MIGSGLDEQLEKSVREHGDTKLIIVDTLQKVREMVSDNYSYSSDYEVIGKLKQFADRHGVCSLIVHHTRKQPAGDSFEKISGTTGLSGCADGALIMQKKTDRWKGYTGNQWTRSAGSAAVSKQRPGAFGVASRPLDMAVNRLTKHLNANASRLLEEHQVKCENKTKHAGRRIRLTYMVGEAPAFEVIE